MMQNDVIILDTVNQRKLYKETPLKLDRLVVAIYSQGNYCLRSLQTKVAGESLGSLISGKLV